MKKSLLIANCVALVLTIAVNYLSNSGMLNGNTMGTVSDSYANYFTPAGYAFSIWGLIYLGLFGFVFYSWRTASEKAGQLVERTGGWFIVSCMANSLWVVAWLYEQTGLSVLIMVLLLVSLLKIIQNLGIGQEAGSFKERLFVHWPFTIYLGWVSVALIANIAAFLTKVDWNGWGIAEVNWAVIMVCVAGLVNLAMIWIRKLQAFALVGIWALLAISVANRNVNGSDAVVTACYTVAGILAISIIVSLFRSKSYRLT